jgi:hypothetical protein
MRMITTHPTPNRTHHDHPSQFGGDPGWCVHIRHDAGERVTVFVRCGVHRVTKTARWERVPAMAHTLHLMLHRMADRDRLNRPKVAGQLSRLAMGIGGMVESTMSVNKVIDTRAGVYIQTTR